MIEIRSATSRDINGILAIMNPIIQDTTITFSPTPLQPDDIAGEFNASAAHSAPYLVAAEGQKVLGFAKYGCFRSGLGYSKTAELTVHLDTCARGRGLGRKLVEQLEHHGRHSGLRSLVAGISAENDSAVQFFDHLGFAEVGRIPQAGHKFGRFIDLLLLQKFL